MPVFDHTDGQTGKQVRREVFHLDPRHDQKTRVRHHLLQMLAPLLVVPADPFVARPTAPRCRAERDGSHHAGALADNQIALLPPHRRHVANVVVMLDQLVPLCRKRRRPLRRHLLNADRSQSGQVAPHRLPRLPTSSAPAPSLSGGTRSRFWQRDVAALLQTLQCHPRAHLLQVSRRITPLHPRAHLTRQRRTGQFIPARPHPRSDSPQQFGRELPPAHHHRPSHTTTSATKRYLCPVPTCGTSSAW